MTIDANELFGGAEKLKAFSKKLDFEAETSPWREKKAEPKNQASRFGMPSDWIVVKNRGENRKAVGFNLTERDAKILASSQRPKVERDEEGLELQLVSFQPMTEQQARTEALLKY